MFSEDNTGNRACGDGLVQRNVCTLDFDNTQGAQSQSGRDIFDVNRLQFRNNTYPGISGNRFKWQGAKTYAQWQALGQQ